MATVAKFDAIVNTSKENGEWEGWIKREDIPANIMPLLCAMHNGNGKAWNVRMDRWIDPIGEVIDTRTHLLAYNDATMPRLVSGHVDYSAWDD